ncbi:helix-turn-helix domain-containing protein [Methylorubrum sp. SB2]|uniref:helix-turn-helix domain-containing protein n=1 Tax=Methylorubrum subtropicum TaxID=3138812 RepID=UPI00313AD379
MTTVPQFAFDTELVAPEHRFEAWRALLGMTHDIAAPKDNFSARVVSTTLDRMVVRSMSASPQTVERSRRRIRADGLDHIVLHRTSAPFDARTEHGDRHVPAGAITVNVLSQPFERGAAAERDSAILSLSRDLVSAWLPEPEAYHGAVLPPGALLAAHMDGLVSHAGRIAPAQGEGLARATAQMLAATLAPTRASLAEAARSREATMLLRCKRHIERRLCAPDLSPDTICRRVGVSRSVLYRLFSEVGGVAQYIRARRLHAARAALAQAGGRRRVSDIAYAYGFTDIAAFSRSFRQAYGLRPSELAAATGPVAETFADTAEADLFSEWMRAVAP